MRVRLPLLTLALLMLAASLAQAQAPGTPLYPPPTGTPPIIVAESPTETAAGEVIKVQLPVPTFPGFVVLLESSAGDPRNPANWSDVIQFPASTIVPPPPTQVMMVSDPPGQPGPCGENEPGMSDSWLAQFGISVGQIVTDPHTVYLVEAPSGNDYGPLSDPSNMGALSYHFISDYEQQVKPGTPLGTVPPGFLIPIAEGPEPVPGQNPLELTPPQGLPFPVVAGYVVLLDKASPNPRDPQFWSDVVVFRCDPASGHSQVGMISDPPTETGFTDTYLAPVGITIADIQNGNTLYMLEGNRADDLNQYVAADPVFGQAIYNIYSDSEGTTPIQGKTWGQIKKDYK